MAKLGEYGEQLPNMTEQEVFNVGCDHLLTQNERSYKEGDEVSNSSCLYDGGSICCAAAPFIANYEKDMEGKAWQEVVLHFNQDSTHSTLIQGLQEVHDCNPTDGWPKALKDLAKRHHLKLTDLLIEKT